MNKLCDECLKAITFNLNQQEILLLTNMIKNHIITPQLAIDEVKMISMVKGLSPYKIKYIIQRFLVTSLISSIKHGTTKYYVTENGKRLIELYMKETSKMLNEKIN